MMKEAKTAHDRGKARGSRRAPRRREGERGLFAMFLISLAGLVASCNAIFGIDEAMLDTSPSGGAGGQGGMPNHCMNNVPDGDETDKDCGGSCGPCDHNQRCNKDADCLSNHCILDSSTSTSSSGMDGGGVGGASNGSGTSSGMTTSSSGGPMSSSSSLASNSSVSSTGSLVSSSSVSSSGSLVSSASSSG